MTEGVAQQIADLINSQNELTIHYTPAKVLEHDRYIVKLDGDGKLLGAVEVKKVQWYQCEIDHLSVDPAVTRRGVGTWLAVWFVFFGLGSPISDFSVDGLRESRVRGDREHLSRR